MERVPFRHSWSRWYVVGLWTIALIFLLVWLFTPVASSNTQVSLIKLVNAGAIVAVGVLLIRTARLGAFTTDDGIVFRNYTNTASASWDDIDRFEQPPPYGSTLRGGLKAHLTDGRVLRAAAIQRGRLESAAGTDASTAYLNRCLQEYRERASDPDSGDAGGH